MSLRSAERHQTSDGSFDSTCDVRHTDGNGADRQWRLVPIG
ncbi:hypothetical protein ACWEN6_40010 [Sphaerisporangium sp. NPDC004334]